MASRKPEPDEAKRRIVEEITTLADAFCREHLNDEYAELCRLLIQKLARKRPTPLVGGRPNTWACGVVRTIGWVNYLDDSARRPHMKLTAIDKALGVAESTGQGKSALIRKMLKIRPLDPEWSLPSRREEPSTQWMIFVDGLPVDARFLKREFQEAAFEAGLIPAIPGRPMPSRDKDDDEP